MQLMQRFGDQIDDAYIDNYLSWITAHPGSCDNVWFATDYGFPPLEKHRENARRYAAYAKRFRAAGVSVSLQVSNTLGHGEGAAASDCTGLIFPGSPAEILVGPAGERYNYCFCFRNPFLRKYTADEIAIYAELLRPECIWIDDDFRPQVGSGFGCFCDGCMAAYNRRFGTAFTREELYEAMCHGDGEHRENWLTFTRDGIAQLAREIGQAVHAASPETALCLQHGPYGAYFASDFDHIFTAMRDSTGHAPLSRPGGGAYNEHDPAIILKKTLDIAWQRATQPDFVKRSCPEVENIPFTAFGKSAAGTALETSMQFAAGATDMTYSMLMYAVEDPAWYEQEFALFAKMRPYWDALSAVNLRTRSAGLRYFASKDARRMPLEPQEDIRALEQNNFTLMRPLMRQGFPVTFDRREEGIILLLREDVRALTEADIAWLLTKNVVLDGEALKALCDHGIDIGVDVELLLEGQSTCLKEIFEPHPAAPRRGAHWASGFARGRDVGAILRPHNPTAEILAHYTPTAGPVGGAAWMKYDGAAAECMVTTAQGGRWAVLGYAPWRQMMPSFVRDHILDVAEYIGGKLPARILTPMMAVLWPRMDEKGGTASVSVLNCTVGESGEIEILVRRPAGKRFVFQSQYNGTAEITPEWRGDEVLLRMPSLAAWSVGTIFAE